MCSYVEQTKSLFYVKKHLLTEMVLLEFSLSACPLENAWIHPKHVGTLQIQSTTASDTSAKNPNGIYVIDSFPIPVCDNIRISRSRLY